MDTKTLEVEGIPPARPGRRRRFNAEEKRRLLAETEETGQSVSSVARRYGLSPSMLFHWRRLVEEGNRPASDVSGGIAGVAVVVDPGRNVEAD